MMRTLTLAAGAVALGIGGVALAYGVLYLLARAGRAWGSDPTPMGTFKTTQPVKDPHEADAIRSRAEQRHQRADDHHADGRAVESGDPPEAKYRIKVAGWR